jgi:hypothetical protein
MQLSTLPCTIKHCSICFAPVTFMLHCQLAAAGCKPHTAQAAAANSAQTLPAYVTVSITFAALFGKHVSPAILYTPATRLTCMLASTSRTSGSPEAIQAWHRLGSPGNSSSSVLRATSAAFRTLTCKGYINKLIQIISICQQGARAMSPNTVVEYCTANWA